MKIVYMGSGDIGLPVLEYLVQHPVHELAGIFTQPDKPAGRSQILTAPPTKSLAMEHGIPVYQPRRIRDPEALEDLERIEPEVTVVMAYGQILPMEVIDAASVACINLHASLLPAHRGAAPIQAAIREGDSETGITVIYIDEGLDSGDIICARALQIRPQETGRSLHDRLADLAPNVLEEALAALSKESAPRLPQDPSAATHAPKLKRADGHIRWDQDAGALERLIRAYDPWPGTFTRWEAGGSGGLQIKIFPPARIVEAPGPSRPGTVLEAGPEGILVATGSEALIVPEVQPEGGRRMSSADFLRGHPLEPGSRFS